MKVLAVLPLLAAVAAAEIVLTGPPAAYVASAAQAHGPLSWAYLQPAFQPVAVPAAAAAYAVPPAGAIQTARAQAASAPSSTFFVPVQFVQQPLQAPVQPFQSGLPGYAFAYRVLDATKSGTDAPTNKSTSPALPSVPDRDAETVEPAAARQTQTRYQPAQNGKPLRNTMAVTETKSESGY